MSINVEVADLLQRAWDEVDKSDAEAVEQFSSELADVQIGLSELGDDVDDVLDNLDDAEDDDDDYLDTLTHDEDFE